MAKNVRILLSKVGLDGHDRGIRIIARALRDAGAEVIYVGPWALLDAVVNTAIQEDVDLVGVSSLAYDHLLVPKLAELLRAAEWDGPLIVGGIVQDDDLPLLADAGVAGVFAPGDPIDDVVRQVMALATGGEPSRAQ